MQLYGGELEASQWPCKGLSALLKHFHEFMAPSWSDVSIFQENIPEILKFWFWIVISNKFT